ncbi:MAG: TIGR00159 family protein [Ruminococcaceae bacterium]|nr:TIGR00159 family protein [Oscillospiraceae bacterium]
MNKFLEFVHGIADTATTYFSVMSLKDVIDILLVGVVLYLVFKFIRDRRAGKLIVGILILAVANFVCNMFELSALGYVLELVFENGILAVVILFQPELRSILEAVGGEPIKSIKRGINMDQNKESTATLRTINEICDAVVDMAKTKTGALIVIERDVKLGDIAKSGEPVDAHITKHLIKNIFFKNSPLHDGAMVIRNNRVGAAGCLLPLSENLDIIRDLGTRHRAAIGMSEKSDAVVIIVSEETGNISVAVNGDITRNYVYATLSNYLKKMLIGEDQKGKKTSHSKSKGKKKKSIEDSSESGI